MCYHVGMKVGKRAALAQETIQYTIRGVPPEVDRALRKRSAKLNLSLNQVVIDELTRATLGHPRRADFAELVGQWTPDPAFDEVIASQRQIDWDKWK